MRRTIHNFPKATRLGAAKESFAEGIGDGLPRDVRPVRCRQNVHDRAFHCRDRHSLILVDLLCFKISPMNHDPFRMLAAKSGRFWNGKTHPRRIYI